MFRTVTVSAFATATLLIATSVHAAAPDNDRLARAISIQALPFTDIVDTRAATTDRRDPDCVGQGATIWYEFTPDSNVAVDANTFGSNYDTTLSVYTGSARNLRMLACNDDYESLQSRVRFTAEAGTTYLIMVGSYASGPGGSLVLNLQAGLAPASAEFQLTVADRAAFNAADGSATIVGRVTCARPLWVSVSGELVQKRRGESVRGFFGVSLWCNGATNWTTRVVAPFQRVRGVPVDTFREGTALVNTGATAYDAETGAGAVRSVRRHVRLQETR